MSKKLIFPKRVKAILVLVLTCLITITLTGCDSSNRKSTGDLNLADEYASAGNYAITVGDLYEELRYYASDYVIDTAFDFVYEAEINEVKELEKNGFKNDPKKVKDKFEELILTDIYGTSDEKAIKELEDKDLLISKFQDTVYKEGYTFDPADFSSVYGRYYLEVAKYVAAWNKLASEFTVEENGTINFGEINDESRFTTTDVVNYYNTNYTNQGTIDAVLVRFINSNEANAVLKKFGIKTDNGKWYQIKLDADETEWNTKPKYDDYYDEYDVDRDGAEHGIKPIEDKATILKIFVALYDYIYTYREGSLCADFTSASLESYKSEKHLQYYRYIEAIINEENGLSYEELKSKLTTSEFVHMTKERVDEYSTSLTTYLYATLKTEAENEGETFTQFTTTAKAYGSYYFMTFKLGQEEDTELYTESTNEDNETVYTFLTDDKAVELKQTILNELFENALDTTYIQEITTERLEDVKIKIYDSAVEAQFMYLSGSELATGYEKTRKSNNNYIASVTYKDKENVKNITVKEVYEYLEPLYGPQVASNLLFDQFIKDSDYYKDLEEEYDHYVETIEMMLYYFANDYYSSSGYPSTIGKYNFMKIYFRTANVEEAVENVLMLTDAKSAFLADFAAHDFKDNKFYEVLRDKANEEIASYHSLTATSLRVYMDKDEDGKEDVLTAEELATAELILKEAATIVESSNDTYENALNAVVADFNASSRLVQDEEDTNEIAPEYTWAYYRSLGFTLEVVSIGEVTNDTTTVADEIADRIEELAENEVLDLVNVKYGFTSAYLDDTYVTSTRENENGEKEEISVSLLLITAGAQKASAKYENEENPDLYKEISVVINDKLTVFDKMDYSSDAITLEQVIVYVSEYLTFSDVYSLPTTTTTTLDSYVLPLIQKYTSEAGQMLIIQNQIGTITYKENNTTNTNRLEELVRISIRVADNYEVEENWWEQMYVKGGNN